MSWEMSIKYDKELLVEFTEGLDTSDVSSYEIIGVLDYVKQLFYDRMSKGEFYVNTPGS